MAGIRDARHLADRLEAALRAGDAEAAESAARAAFADPAAGEDDLAPIAGLIFESGFHPAFDLVEGFVERFPDSVHGIRAYLADLHAQSGNFDRATVEARIYLRLVRDRGLLPKLDAVRIVQAAASRAFLLLTAAYTELGARSYSARVLDLAQKFALDPEWRETLVAERSRLADELADPAVRAADVRWEAFFAGGRQSGSLIEECLGRGYPAMAQRLDLIEAQFRFDPAFRCGGPEILQLVRAAAPGSLVLR
ncbi:MAG: hypothetical protein JNK75_12820 [Betaproteobacteria bacterium]|nr:hypothetical protein [Betaproteobacteria bacterium]